MDARPGEWQWLAFPKTLSRLSISRQSCGAQTLVAKGDSRTAHKMLAANFIARLVEGFCEDLQENMKKNRMSLCYKTPSKGP